MRKKIEKTLSQKIARQHTGTVKDLLNTSLQNPVVKEEYEDYSAILEASRLIKEMRLGAGLTQEQLATKLGVSQTVIGRIEAGKSKRGPTITMLERIAKACDYRMALAATRATAAKALNQDVFHVEVMS